MSALAEPQVAPRREVAELPPCESIDFGEVLALSLSAPTTSGTHGLHRFPAKFVPQVPRWALREFAPPGATVLDPFAGSGTTLVESTRFPVRAAGIDLDPLACFIARAKVDPPPGTQLASSARAVAANARRLLRSGGAFPMRDVANVDHWFTATAQGELHALFHAIDSAPVEARTRGFLLVIASSILRRVSRADDQSMKTYVSHTNPKDPPAVFETFDRAVERAVAGIAELEDDRHPGSQRPVVLEGNACALPQDDHSVDLMVTSPPYLDSVDYQYNLMVEYFWLGPRLGVESRAALNVLRRTATGAKRPLAGRDALPAPVRDVIDQGHVAVDRWRSVVRYLRDLDLHFAEASRCLKTGGRYVFVVGNSASRNGEVPVHDCAVQLAAAHGLELAHAFGYRVRRHYMKFPRKGRGGIILVDWVLVFERVERLVDVPGRLPLLAWTLPPDAVAH